MNRPLISIIVPVYNVEKYLSQCLNSVTNQTYKDTEIIKLAERLLATEEHNREEFKEFL